MEDSRQFESPLDVESQTLLDVMKEKNRAAGKRVAVHQLVYIGKLREESTSQKAADHIHKTIKMLHEKYLEIGGGTGLLLFQGSYFVHQIESSSQFLNDLMQEISSDMDLPDGYFEEEKIIIISHNISRRLFSQWNRVVIRKSTSFLQRVDDDIPTVNELLQQLLKLAAYLATVPKLHLCNILEELTERVPQLIPKEETLQSLLQQAIFLTPKDFMSRLLLPRNKTLESDITWPAPIRIVVYLLKDN
ncbi:testis-expressed protein 47-like [Tachypleus tridentatus]|uniref:testis-expressed protein 47-like n=1 Tax=Tachypleus tridentatus TaxID=6853 RepID=UPI003FD4813C